MLPDASCLRCSTKIGEMSISSNYSFSLCPGLRPNALLAVREPRDRLGHSDLQSFSILASDHQEHCVIRHSFRMSPVLLIRYGTGAVAMLYQHVILGCIGVLSRHQSLRQVPYCRLRAD